MSSRWLDSCSVTCFNRVKMAGLIALTLAVPLVLTFAVPSFAAGDNTVRMPTVTPQMLEYSRIKYALYFLTAFYIAGMQFLIMQTGLSKFARDRAEEQSKREVWRFLSYYGSIYMVMCLALIPLSFCSGFALEHVFKLTSENLGDWTVDSIKHSFMAFCLSAPLAGVFFFFVRKFPRGWPWLFFAACSFTIFFDSFISPIVLEPVMNKFTPMPSGDLRNRIEALATKYGASGAPVYIADKSRQTDKLNAYVSGLAGTTHIVVWDTTMHALPPDQIVAIVGHELGHYRLHHVQLDCFLGVLANALVIPINILLARPFVARLPKRWGVRGLGDYAVIPVIALVITVSDFAFDPIINAWSRKQEHDADAYSLQVTGDGAALARSFVSLSEKNLSDPDPPAFIVFWLFSHPTLKERIQFALKGVEQSTGAN